MQKTNKIINWGIIGTGWIAHKFVDGLNKVKNTQIVAILSRTMERAKKFSNQYNIENSYADYADFLNNKEIDIVYIASPHSCHFSDTMRCLDYGKAVLCEKPLAINSFQVNEMIKRANEKKLFFMEALWTAFLPSVKKIKEIIESGIIGNIEAVKADLGLRSEFNPDHRHYNKALGGGSLLDVGIYPVYLAYEFLGIPLKINALASIGKTGVDEHCSMVFQYKNGQMAHLSSSIVADTGVEAVIAGTKGRIHLSRRFFMPVKITLFDNNDNFSDITPNYIGNGYNYEIYESVNCILKGKTQSTIFSHKNSVDLMSILDEIRKLTGITYPEDLNLD